MKSPAKAGSAVSDTPGRMTHPGGSDESGQVAVRAPIHSKRSVPESLPWERWATRMTHGTFFHQNAEYRDLAAGSNLTPP